jgi:trigger factor
MPATIEEISPQKFCVTVEVPAEEVDQLLDLILAKLQPRARLKGFRPGKVPKSVMIARFQSVINTEFIEKHITGKIFEAIKERSLEPASPPMLEENFKIVEGQSLVCRATFEIIPQFDLPPLEELELTKIVYPPATDEEINQYLNYYRRQGATSSVLDDPEAAVKKGHLVKVGDVSFAVDGTPTNPELSRKLEYLEAGHPGGWLEPLELALVGRKVGDLVEVAVTFPEGLTQTDGSSLAGQQAVCSLKIEEIMVVELPELDDDYVKGLELGLDDLPALKSFLREQHHLKKLQAAKDQLQVQIVDKLTEFFQGIVPQPLIENEISTSIGNISRRYLPADPKAAQKQLNALLANPENRDAVRADAEKSCKSSIVCDKIAADFSLTVSDEELAEELRRIKASVGPDPQFEKTMASASYRNNVAARLRMQKIFELVISKAKVTEVPPPELAENPAANETPVPEGETSPEGSETPPTPEGSETAAEGDDRS